MKKGNTMLDNIQSALFEIKRVLIEDEEIRKLLYNDSNDALNLDTPSIESVDDYISLYPVYEFNTESGGYNHNCGISIGVSVIDPVDEVVQVIASLSINVLVNSNKWVLTGNKIRPLEIADRIIELLENKKFSTSSTLSFDGMTNLIMTKRISGYALSFTMNDGTAKIENF